MKRKKITAITTILAIGISLFGFSFRVFGAEQKNINDSTVITFKNNTINEKVKNIIEDNGGKIIKEIPQIGVLEVKCDEKILSEIKDDKSIESSGKSKTIKIDEPENKYYKIDNPVYFVDDNKPYYGGDLFDKNQWDIKRVTKNGESFYLEPGNHSIVVGIVDSGIYANHPDLKNNYLGGKNLVTKNYRNDETEKGDTSDVQDRLGHGTMVAGEIAANGRTKGVAPGIGFKSYRVIDRSGMTDASIVAEGIVSAVDDGVNVINLSLGLLSTEGHFYSNNEAGERTDYTDNLSTYKVIQSAVNYAEKHNVVVVSAAGNSNLDCSTPEKLAKEITKFYNLMGYKGTGIEKKAYLVPACLPNVINVSSTTKDDNLSSFSNYGQGIISVAAPGGELVKDKDGKGLDKKEECYVTCKDNKYDAQCGTSLAAPKVSAEAALILCKNKNLTPKDVKKKICESADKVGDEAHYGAGIINVYNALK